MAEADSADTLMLTAEIVAAYLGAGSRVNADDIPALIRAVRAVLSEGETPEAAAAEPSVPKAEARAVKKSITPDALISFIDNKPYKTLKRHLSGHGLDIAGYRERYGLPSNYPSTAANYSAARSEMAKKIGLGAKGRQSKVVAAEAKAPAVKKVRKGAATAKK